MFVCGVRPEILKMLWEILLYSGFFLTYRRAKTTEKEILIFDFLSFEIFLFIPEDEIII